MNTSLLNEGLGQQRKVNNEEEEKILWKTKPLHGMCHRQIEEVADIQTSYQWLEKASSRTAQEQALSTRSKEAGTPPRQSST